MSGLLTEEILHWIGHGEPPVTLEVTRRDIIKYAIATDQRSERFLRGDEAPPMFLFGADRPLARLDELGPDGLRVDASGPDLPLKRVMAGGTKQRYHRPVRPGDVLTIRRTISDIFEKQGSSGPLIFVVSEIAVTDAAGEPVMHETLTRIHR